MHQTSVLLKKTWISWWEILWNGIVCGELFHAWNTAILFHYGMLGSMPISCFLMLLSHVLFHSFRSMMDFSLMHSDMIIFIRNRWRINNSICICKNWYDIKILMRILWDLWMSILHFDLRNNFLNFYENVS
jgi:hypothetical protein